MKSSQIFQTNPQSKNLKHNNFYPAKAGMLILMWNPQAYTLNWGRNEEKKNHTCKYDKPVTLITAMINMFYLHKNKYYVLICIQLSL